MRTITTLLPVVLAVSIAVPAAWAEVRAPERPAETAKPGGGLSAAGNYRLDCWQGGQKVLSEAGTGEVLLPVPAAGGSVQVKDADGGRRLILIDGDSLCRVTSQPPKAD